MDCDRGGVPVRCQHLSEYQSAKAKHFFCFDNFDRARCTCSNDCFSAISQSPTFIRGASSCMSAVYEVLDPESSVG